MSDYVPVASLPGVESLCVAMTFDDGPHPTNTPRLLDIAAEKQITLSFFVLGALVEKNAALLRRAVAEGHEIGNHSWSHANLSKLSNDELYLELQQADDIIFGVIGARPTIMRPPYGELTKVQRQWIRSVFGYSIVFWDVDPLDWTQPGAKVITNRLLNGIRPGSIALAHDIYSQTIGAMPRVIGILLECGFSFSTVSQLLATSTILTTRT